MVNSDVKIRYFAYLAELISDFDRYNIDGFIIDEELSDEDVEELLSIPVVVVDGSGGKEW